MKKKAESVLTNKQVNTLLGVAVDHVRNAWSDLSPRESEIAELMSLGHSAATISKELGISSKTLDIHRSKIRRKLGVEGWAYLGVAYAALVLTGGLPEVTDNRGGRKSA